MILNYLMVLAINCRVDPRERPNIVQLRNHKFIRNDPPVHTEIDNNCTLESLSVNKVNQIQPTQNSKS